jgi:hypothetical protein
VHLIVNEWRFQPKQLQLPVGQAVTLVLDNDGQLDHDVSVQLNAGAGTSTRQTITATRAGTLIFTLLRETGMRVGEVFELRWRLKIVVAASQAPEGGMLAGTLNGLSLRRWVKRALRSILSSIRPISRGPNQSHSKPPGAIAGAIRKLPSVAHCSAVTYARFLWLRHLCGGPEQAGTTQLVVSLPRTAE